MGETRTIVPFQMPSLGAGMETGKLVEWLVGPDQQVRHGDIVAVVETEKGAIEIEIFEDAMFRRLLIDVGETVPVGTPIAEIEVRAAARAAGGEVPAIAFQGQGAPGETARAPSEPALPAESPVPHPPPVQSAAPVTGSVPPRSPAAPREVYASPAARRMAQAANLDLSALQGSGPGGAIVVADVEAAIRRRGQSGMAPRKTGVDLDAMRRAIGAAMAQSKREIPHYYLEHHCDLGSATAWLAATNAERPPDRRLLMGALFVKAVAKALREAPAMNGHFVDGTFRPSGLIHVGLAVALRGGGLTAPAIRDTDALDLDALMARMRDLVARARAGRLRASEMTDATITVSSLGDRGVEAMTAVIYPPQVAIVGFGTPLERPWMVGGAVVPRPVLAITLAADHRVSDGRSGARFLRNVVTLLETPEAL